MPMKKCPNCSVEVGPRTKTCKCGAVFGEKQIPIVVEPVSSPEVFEIPKKSSKRKRIVLTPSEKCPFAPEGYKSEKFVTTKSVVQDWARRIVNSTEDTVYTVDAVMYWARNYWDIHSSEWWVIRNYIYSAFEPEENF
jgi:hypothetical protein